MKWPYLWMTLSGLAWLPPAGAQELNVLVIGSTHSFSEGGEAGVVHEKPFDPTDIATHLQGILSQDPAITSVTPTVNVEFEDIYKTKSQAVNYSGSAVYDFTSHCYSLAQHFFWTDGRADRMAKLRGAAPHRDWDYIILCNDPYITANFPGMVAEGVKLIQGEVAKGSAELVLLAHWPKSNPAFDAADVDEVMQRVGACAGVTVVPAGMAWDSYTDKDTDTAHPTPRGEFLAAAAIYSQLFARSANSSTYTYDVEGANDSGGIGSAIADHVLSVVQSSPGATPFGDAYDGINPFQMKQVTKRVVSYRETGTSTEDRIALALGRLDDVCGIDFITTGPKWDFNYGRGNDWWEDDKDYEVDPLKHDRAYGFPMHHYTVANALNTMPYGIDKHYYYGSTYEDGTDLGIAYNMIRPGTRESSLPADVRAIPIRLMWLKMRERWPTFNPLGDNTHMHPYLNDASAAFMYTLLSGRCPVVPEPTGEGTAAWMQWLGHKVGYETAWQMSHLTTRAPGMRVLPSSTSATTVTSTVSETMTLRFAYPPQADVTVMVTSSNPAVATVSPATLTFTPANHATPQQVIVTGVDAGIGLQDFEVQFTTTCGDKVYDGLTDAWPYTCDTQGVRYDETVLLAGFDGTNTRNTNSKTAGVLKQLSNPRQSATAFGNLTATLSTTSALEQELQWAGMTSPATWGSAALIPPATTTNNCVFTTNNAATFDLLLQNTGDFELAIETLHFRLNRDSATGGGASEVNIALASGALASSGPGVQPLVASSGANNYNFNLGSILTDARLGPGESATFTFSVAPADPAGTNRRIRVDNLAISGKAIQPANTFASWLSGFDVGAATGFGDDPDKDGLANGVESYFGSHPGEFTPGLRSGAVGTGTFTFSHPIADTPPGDVTAAYRWSKDLSSFYASGQSDPAGTTLTIVPGTPADGRVPVTATLTGTPSDKIFVDVEVTQE